MRDNRGTENHSGKVEQRLRKRILEHAEKHYAGKYNRIDLRCRDKFCYIDAYVEPRIPEENYNIELFGEPREQRMERLRNIPTHLCRLRYFGNDDRWSMAFYTYSHEKYEPCLFNSGKWEGTPEEAFDASAVYLTD